MRVLVQALVAAPGGSVTVLRDLVAAWPAEDDLQLVCWRPEAAALLAEVGHAVTALTAGSTPEALLRLRVAPPEAVRRFDADVVWSQAILVERLGRPQAVHYRDIGSFLAIHPDTPRQRLKQRRERRDLARADLRIFNSATMRAAAAARHPGAADLPSVVVHNGLDLTPIERAARPRSVAGVAGTVSAGNRRGGSVLRLLLPQSDAPHKRNARAAEIVAALLAAPPAGIDDVHLTVTGKGEYRELRAALATHGIAERMRFTGYVSRTQMGELYASHDVVLLTGAAESFGNPFVEAHAAGRPIVSPPYPVARELSGPLGVIAARDDVAALVDAVRTAAALPDDAATTAAASRFADMFRAERRALALREELAGLVRGRVGR
jgi:glycosyltransferase involved in cell wall biosynthesis